MHLKIASEPQAALNCTVFSDRVMSLLTPSPSTTNTGILALSSAKGRLPLAEQTPGEGPAVADAVNVGFFVVTPNPNGQVSGALVTCLTSQPHSISTRPAQHANYQITRRNQSCTDRAHQITGMRGNGTPLVNPSQPHTSTPHPEHTLSPVTSTTPLVRSRGGYAAQRNIGQPGRTENRVHADTSSAVG